MREVRRQGIDYHISETDLHNQNPFEGSIRKMRQNGTALR